MNFQKTNEKKNYKNLEISNQLANNTECQLSKNSERRKKHKNAIILILQHFHSRFGVPNSFSSFFFANRNGLNLIRMLLLLNKQRFK